VADIGIATHSLEDQPELVALPCYRWTHVVIVPPGHALLDGPLTLARLAEFPVITYDAGVTGRGSIDDAFARAGLKPQVVLSAMDADVIKTYVALGLGVGIIAAIAFDEARDAGLRSVDARHLFRSTPPRWLCGGAPCCAATPTPSSRPSPPTWRRTWCQAQAAPAGTPSAPL
jgi:LysR family cys regulon transcriptional activator